MTSVMEHCDHKCLEHCDDRGHGSFLLQGAWSIVMTRTCRKVIPRFMEDCDDNGNGVL